MKHVDVVIIGAGIAGCVLAMNLPSTLSVVVLDKKHLDGRLPSFMKPCGGLIAPDAQKTLKSLKLTIPNEVLSSPQMFSVKTMDLRSQQLRHYPRRYINIHRHQLDLWLASLIPPHIEIIDGVVVKTLSKESDHVTISYMKDDQEYFITANVCVGADGAHSMVRKLCHAPKIRQYLAIQEKFDLGLLSPHLGCFFDQELTDSYAWMNIKDTMLEFGAALPLNDSLQRYEQFKEKLIAHGYPLKLPLHKDACLVNSPKTLKQIYLGDGPFILVGEAAGWISPSSLEGMSYAMDSALLLAKAFESKNVLKTYDWLSKKLKLKIFLKQLKSIVLYTPWMRYCVMKSGVTSTKFPSNTHEK